MNGDPGSLADLRDLVLPPMVAFWPPAPGVAIVAAALLTALAIALARAVARHRANAYRRAALAEIDAIAQGGGAAGDVVGAVSAVMKRAALVAYPRARVAPLTGAAWARFLAETAGRGFDAAAVAPALAGAYGDGPARRADDLRGFLAQARIWVRGHVASAAGAGG